MLRIAHSFIEEVFMKSSLFQTPPRDDRAPWWLFWLLVVIALLSLLIAWWTSRKETPAVEKEEPIMPAPINSRLAPEAAAQIAAEPPVVEPLAAEAVSPTLSIPEAIAEIAIEEPVVEVAEPVPFKGAIASPPTPTAADDLTIIEGIGPKISGWLNEAGITTFAQLAATPPEKIEEILLNAGHRIANPGTWPEQAALAAAGPWAELNIMQDNLHGGRRKQKSEE